MIEVPCRAPRLAARVFLFTVLATAASTPLSAGRGPGGRGAAGAQRIQRYDGERGIAIHYDGDRLLFDIPRGLVGADLVATERRIADRFPPASEALPGKLFDARIVRWERVGDSLAFRWREHDGTYTLGRRVPIIGIGPEGSLRVDMTPAYVQTVWLQTLMRPEIGEASPERSVLRFARAIADGVELEVEHALAGRTVTMRWTLQPLPRIPMRGRLPDSRVLFYTTDQPGGLANGPGLQSGYILRQRLEKRDPSAAVSEPVEPLVFYIDPSVPASLRPWFKQGVEAWAPVLEAAGFRHAIVARDLPTDSLPGSENVPRNLIVWSQGGGWAANTNNTGIDPETGEILGTVITASRNAELQMQQVGFNSLGANPAIPLPFPDSLRGELWAMSIAHEVGHALGLNHNFKAGATYSTDSLRSAAFVRRMGSTPSIMDYNFFNSVAQPEDSIPFRDLHARIGPYDVFAIQWGYRPVPGATTPEEEQATLETWRQAQDTAAYLRGSVFSPDNVDPSEDVLGSDFAKGFELYARTRARVGARLMALSPSGLDTVSPLDAGEDRYTPRLNLALVRTLQNGLLDGWTNAMNWRVPVVGGQVPQAPYARDVDAQVYVPIDSAQQIAVVRMIFNHLLRGQDDMVQGVLATPAAPLRTTAAFLQAEELPEGWDISFLRQRQIQIVDQLLDPDRLDQVAKQSTTYHTRVFQVLCTELAALRQEIEPVAKSASTGFLADLWSRLKEPVTTASASC